MRQRIDVDKEIWCNKGELLTYLKEVMVMMKKNRKKENLKKS